MRKFFVFVFVVLSVFSFSEILSVKELNLEDFQPKYPLITYDALKTNNGKNGNDAWISVNGIVYDVTYLKDWKNGKHKGYEAGKDLTYEITELSPHGLGKLEKAETVGYLIFTLEELKKFNGKNGNKAYVAVNGIVYDVTHSKLWKNGEHKGQHEAGKDLTYEITELSPHGLKKLENVYKIGLLIK